MNNISSNPYVRGFVRLSEGVGGAVLLSFAIKTLYRGVSTEGVRSLSKLKNPPVVVLQALGGIAFIAAATFGFPFNIRGSSGQKETESEAEALKIKKDIGNRTSYVKLTPEEERQVDRTTIYNYYQHWSKSSNEAKRELVRCLFTYGGENLAFQPLKELVEEGYKEFTYLLAYCYYEGFGCSKDEVEGNKLMNNLGKDAYIEQACKLAYVYSEKGDQSNFESWTNKAREKDEGSKDVSKKVFDFIYEHENINYRDESIGIKWLRQEAIESDYAKYLLALCLDAGYVQIKTQKYREEAIKLLTDIKTKIDEQASLSGVVESDKGTFGEVVTEKLAEWQNKKNVS